MKVETKSRKINYRDETLTGNFRRLIIDPMNVNLDYLNDIARSSYHFEVKRDWPYFWRKVIASDHFVLKSLSLNIYDYPDSMTKMPWGGFICHLRDVNTRLRLSPAKDLTQSRIDRMIKVVDDDEFGRYMLAEFL